MGAEKRVAFKRAVRVFHFSSEHFPLHFPLLYKSTFLHHSSAFYILQFTSAGLDGI
jgi:hypothetical protein